ncbi:unnamed protein product [Echinostoma caproni]|uniref:Retrotransposon protein n=1 Tax=Echinostoma caproni TaxID=27848 RepID=A0A183ACM0_9TREM|nr:unnamed protein product [Echinostoma caproni]
MCQSRFRSWYQRTVHPFWACEEYGYYKDQSHYNANNDKPVTSHLQHLIVQCSGNVGGIKLLKRFVARNMAIKPTKRIFVVSELELLGFTVDARGHSPDPTRFKTSTNIESSKDQTHLRSVMGNLQYYSLFIPNFATRAQPPFRAQCLDAWEWSLECEDI